MQIVKTNRALFLNDYKNWTLFGKPMHSARRNMASLLYESFDVPIEIFSGI